MAKDIQFVTLVKATEEDYDFFYNLKCEQSTNYWAGYREPPNYMRLKEWYQNVLINKTKDILIIKYNHIKVGYVSFKINNDICEDFSISISEKYVGQGLGACAMKRLGTFIKDYYPNCCKFVSYVRTDNIPSQIIHARNGFNLTSEYEDKYLESDNKVIRLEKWVKYLVI